MARQAWQGVLGRVLVLGIAQAAMMGSAASSAMAAPVATGELDENAEGRFLVEQLTADKAIAVARERRLADADQEALYERLGQKDRALRKAEEKVAFSRDPRKRAALERFARGEVREALGDLDIKDAARRRPQAWLAALGRDQGKVSVDEVITRYEALTKLDPGMTWDWIVKLPKASRSHA